MRPYLRIILLLIILLLGYKAIKEEFGPQYSGFLTIQNLALVGLIVSTVTAFLIDITYFRPERKVLQFITSFIGMILCAIVFFISSQQNAIDKAKTILTISNKPGATNVITIEFKDNDKFRLREYDKLGHTIYYGKYLISGDTLKILNSNYNGYAKELPTWGIIRNDSVYWARFDIMVVRKE